MNRKAIISFVDRTNVTRFALSNLNRGRIKKNRETLARRYKSRRHFKEKNEDSDEKKSEEALGGA